jgi:tetratricopeptide (TPR) repeat protein
MLPRLLSPLLGLTLVLSVTPAPPALSQVVTEGGDQQPQRQQQPRQQNNGRGGGGVGLGSDLPFIDPATETMAWDGQLWNIGDNRLMRARFEKYLTTPPALTEEDLAYRAVIDAILHELAPTNQQRSLPNAVALLPEAAQYPIDARLCDSLANAIWGVWLSQRNQSQLAAANEGLRNRRRQLEWNFETSAAGTAFTRAREQGAGRPGPRGGGGGGGGEGGEEAPRSTGLVEFSRVGGYIKDITELEARMLANETEAAASEIAMRLEYEAITVQFFLQRRFEHTVMATRFYRHLFSDGGSAVNIEEGSDVDQFFSASGVSPTIGGLDAAANEIIRDVDEAILAFDALIETGDLDSASQRLMEAFLVGEYLHRVRAVPTEKKRLVLDFVRYKNRLLSALEVKDYGRADEIVKEMMEVSKDFDPAQPLAAINIARQTSDFHIQQAKTAFLGGDAAAGSAELQRAAEAWPTNPRLSEASETLGRAADIKTQAILDFDSLLAQRNHRRIFEDQGRFAGALIDDPERREQLGKIIADVTRLNTIVYGAEQAAQAGAVERAYEEIEKAYLDFPNDPQINRLRSDLAIRASDFVAAIQRANDLKERGQHGSALAWYLTAETIYERSQLAEDGIRSLLDSLRPGTPSSSPTSAPPRPTPPPSLSEFGDPFASPAELPPAPAPSQNGSFIIRE